MCFVPFFYFGLIKKHYTSPKSFLKICKKVVLMPIRKVSKPDARFGAWHLDGGDVG